MKGEAAAVAECAVELVAVEAPPVAKSKPPRRTRRPSSLQQQRDRAVVKSSTTSTCTTMMIQDSNQEQSTKTKTATTRRFPEHKINAKMKESVNRRSQATSPRTALPSKPPIQKHLDKKSLSSTSKLYDRKKKRQHLARRLFSLIASARGGKSAASKNKQQFSKENDSSSKVLLGSLAQEKKKRASSSSGRYKKGLDTITRGGGEAETCATDIGSSLEGDEHHSAETARSPDQQHASNNNRDMRSVTTSAPSIRLPSEVEFADRNAKNGNDDKEPVPRPKLSHPRSLPARLLSSRGTGEGQHYGTKFFESIPEGESKELVHDPLLQGKKYSGLTVDALDENHNKVCAKMLASCLVKARSSRNESSHQQENTTSPEKKQSLETMKELVMTTPNTVTVVGKDHVLSRAETNFSLIQDVQPESTSLLSFDRDCSPVTTPPTKEQEWTCPSFALAEAIDHLTDTIAAVGTMTTTTAATASALMPTANDVPAENSGNRFPRSLSSAFSSFTRQQTANDKSLIVSCETSDERLVVDDNRTDDDDKNQIVNMCSNWPAAAFLEGATTSGNGHMNHLGGASSCGNNNNEDDDIFSSGGETCESTSTLAVASDLVGYVLCAPFRVGGGGGGDKDNNVSFTPHAAAAVAAALTEHAHNNNNNNDAQKTESPEESG